ncbi:MAG: DUF5103 domain-containing protein [Bacteroidetes bacterium]|nr:DUF5103 domain-containing protein [Bacteroidota bacterium]
MCRYTIILITVIFITTNLEKGFGQTANFINLEKVYTDAVNDSLIHTVELNISGTRLSYPVLKMNSDKQLVLSFDVLSSRLKNYAYTFIHCNSNWEPSNLSQFEYLDGYYDNPVEEYEFSVNTILNYVHYTVRFPNNNVKLLKSGNYIILVYEEGNPEKIVITRRFMLVEDRLEIQADRKRPVKMDFFDSGQEIDIELLPGGYPIADPYNDIKLVVLQNYGWLTQKTFTRPRFIEEGKLSYDYDERNVFDGHKEFRFFDIRSLRYNGRGVANIEFLQPNYHVTLQRDEVRTYKPYLYNEDFNGRYYIELQEYSEDDIRADYATVYFSLDLGQPYDKGAIYLYGQLTNWEIDERFKLSFNWDKRIYETDLLLKQGFYNYMYAYKPMKEKEANLKYLEGSSYETENDYLIMIYHQKSGERYERLIGYRVFNTLDKNADGMNN